MESTVDERRELIFEWMRCNEVYKSLASQCAAPGSPGISPRRQAEIDELGALAATDAEPIEGHDPAERPARRPKSPRGR